MEDGKNKTVLITGFSSGIGKALSHQFARDGFDIIGVARDKSKMEATTKELQQQYGIEVQIIQKDLAQDGAAKEVYEEAKAFGKPIHILVNDAGVGQHGKFVDIPYERYAHLIHLNIISLTHLTRLFLKDMVERDHGKVLNLGSVAGFQPGPLLAVYHATKAYVVSLSEALATELEEMESKVTVTCLCPGPTDTDFFTRADMEETNVVHHKDKLMMPPEEVAEGAYKALMDGERIFIPGTMNKISTFIRRVIPKSTQSKTQMKYYEHHED
ncbi:SDR family NAD(P)-dependent oxidoreductase [Salinimicrobium oceani]|uniref:SDR family oxidoreductase n=1 Tax=Salinimicrobium oceani TaxID=2722702 RepID=A0ABX1D1T8_9FLAO|nr:SDR family oxidoreductase [Salinimicrobium oceani]NJW52511.1 SDR family oxidoreductase [Salinimicrobium oceani]